MDISILGCGWLGFPLAKHLISRGYSVKGSTTSGEKLQKLADNNIQPYLINLDPELEPSKNNRQFWNSDVLVLNIPSRRKQGDIIPFLTRQIASVAEAVNESSIEFVIFISSTSVYPKYSGEVSENDAIPGKAIRDSGNALLEVEELLLDNISFKTTVLRFGGLIGYDRHPANYLAGKQDLDRAKAPVNLIHRDDCIKIITKIIENRTTGEIFNAVADEHPTRKDFYRQTTKELNLEPPTFKHDTKSNYKIVSNKKLKSVLNYNFIYPDPIKLP